MSSLPSIQCVLKAGILSWAESPLPGILARPSCVRVNSLELGVIVSILLSLFLVSLGRSAIIVYAVFLIIKRYLVLIMLF